MLFSKFALTLLGAATIAAALPTGIGLHANLARDTSVVGKRGPDSVAKVDSELSGRQNCGGE